MGATTQQEVVERAEQLIARMNKHHEEWQESRRVEGLAVKAIRGKLMWGELSEADKGNVVERIAIVAPSRKAQAGQLRQERREKSERRERQRAERARREAYERSFRYVVVGGIVDTCKVLGAYLWLLSLPLIVLLAVTAEHWFPDLLLMLAHWLFPPGSLA